MTTTLEPCTMKGCFASRHHYHRSTGKAVGHSVIDASCEDAPRCYGPVEPTKPALKLEVAADAPSLVTLPTVDEIARQLLDAEVAQGEIDGEWDDLDDYSRDSYLYTAGAVLAMLAARVPHWVKIEPGEIKPGMRVRWSDGDMEHSFTVREVDGPYLSSGASGVYMTARKFEVDPRTIPAEPVDPALAVVAMWLEEDDRAPDTTDRMADLLARIDAARADA